MRYCALHRGNICHSLVLRKHRIIFTGFCIQLYLVSLQVMACNSGGRHRVDQKTCSINKLHICDNLALLILKFLWIWLIWMTFENFTQITDIFRLAYQILQYIEALEIQCRHKYIFSNTIKQNSKSLFGFTRRLLIAVSATRMVTLDACSVYKVSIITWRLLGGYSL